MANDYAADLLCALARFGEDIQTLAIPAYEPGKRPVDEYKRLVTCFGLLEQIAQQSGLTVLQLTPDIDASIVPSDVYDLAFLMVSEPRYPAALIGAKLPHAPARQTCKIPPQVYQRVEFLQAQLCELPRLVQLYPNWYTMKP